MRGTWVVLVVSLASAVTPRVVSAQSSDDVTRTAARALGYAGVEAYQAGDYESASEKLEKAYVVLRAPSLGLWSARALAKRGKLVEASGRYLEVTTLEVSGGDVDVQKQAQADAKIELDLLGPRIPNLVVQIEGAEPQDVTVMLDARPLATALIGEALSLNPGRHVLEARRGNEKQNAEVTLDEEQRETIVLRFTPPAPATPAPAAAPVLAPVAPPVTDRRSSSPQRTLGWATLGVGAAGIAVGSITGLMALSKHGEIEDHEACADDRCARTGGSEELVNSYNSLRTFSSIGFIAGGVLAAGGAALILTAPNESRSSLSLSLGPRSAALRARF